MGEFTGERFLVTGALGCLGAWTLKALVDLALPVVALDSSTDRHRVEMSLSPDETEGVTFAQGDITDLAVLLDVLDRFAVTNVIHLAALQVPACRLDPPFGALVNVVGTVNVFEAVKRRGLTSPVAFAGSIGMFDLGDADPMTFRLASDAQPHPRTNYGVYKQANEGTARVYWQDHGVASVAIRPMTVYGPGRDQGLTSAPTRAIAAAVQGSAFHIPFGGRTFLNYAPDVVTAFVAASRSDITGARAVNVGGAVVDIADFVKLVEEIVPGAGGLITFDDQSLPFPADIETADIEELIGELRSTKLSDGIRETFECFRALHAQRRLVV